MQMSDNALDGMADLFSALAHPLRLSLLRLLLQRPMCVSRLAAALDAPQPTVSRNLAILRRAGLVRRQQHEAFVRYELAEDVQGQPLRPLWDLILAIVADLYDEETVECRLAAQGIRTPPW